MKNMHELYNFRFIRLHSVSKSGARRVLILNPKHPKYEEDEYSK